MSDRLPAIAHRLEMVDQLDAVVTAMRGIAAARQHEAETQLEAIRTYAATIGDAIGSVLVLMRDRPVASVADGDRELLILMGGEQGFAGSFSDQALDRAQALVSERARPPELVVVGSRACALAAARGMPIAWKTAMPLHVREVAVIANRITEELYRQLAHAAVTRITLLHGMPDDGGAAPGFRLSRLLPFDYGRFPTKPLTPAPLLMMPPTRLLRMLAEEYVFGELCEALALAFAAENGARLRAMMAVSENIREMGEKLKLSMRQRRQEAITEEVIELASSSLPVMTRRSQCEESA
jgi:F-type H+-transporting ATPase subunit gamma